MIMILDQGGGYCSPCNTIWKNVDKLPSLDEASRNHAYVLPDNSVWVLNHDGTEFITSHNGTVDLSSKQDKLVAGEGIEITGNVISTKNNHSEKLKAGYGIKIEDNEISLYDPRRMFTISRGLTELEGMESPICILTVEDIRRFAVDVQDEKMTIDIVVGTYTGSDPNGSVSYTTNIGEEAKYYLNRINDKYGKISVGEITIDIDGNNVIFKGITSLNQRKAFSATYYLPVILALP